MQEASLLLLSSSPFVRHRILLSPCLLPRNSHKTIQLNDPGNLSTWWLDPYWFMLIFWTNTDSVSSFMPLQSAVYYLLKTFLLQSENLLLQTTFSQAKNLTLLTTEFLVAPSLLKNGVYLLMAKPSPYWKLCSWLIYKHSFKSKGLFNLPTSHTVYCRVWWCLFWWTFPFSHCYYLALIPG